MWSRGGALCLVLLFAGRLPAASTPVTLVGHGLSLGEALERLAKQSNRCFRGPALADPARLAKSYDFDWHKLSLPAALDRLHELAALDVDRIGRTTYTVVPTRGPARPGRTETVGDWQVKLVWIRYYLSGEFRPADPQLDSGTAALTWSLLLQAPDDDEALRLVGTAPPAAETADGQPVTARPTGYMAGSPDYGNPSLWQVTGTAPMPQTNATELSRLWLDLRFAAGLQRVRLVFDKLTEGAVAEGDGCSAKLLEAGARNQRWYCRVACGTADGRPLGPLMVEGRLADAAGQPLLTDTYPEGTSGTAPNQVSRYRCLPVPRPWLDLGQPVAAPPVPARLELLLTRPEGAESTVRATFTHVPLPPRRPLPKAP